MIFLLGCAALLGAVLGVAGWRTWKHWDDAPARKRAIWNGVDNFVVALIGCIAVGSYVYRPEITERLLALWGFLLAVWDWYWSLTWWKEILYLGLAYAFVYEGVFVWGRRYLHRQVWRRWFPDLCLIREEGRSSHVIGRLYAKEVLPGDRGVRLFFTPYNAGWFDWINNRSQIDVPTAPMKLSATSVAIHGEGIERDPEGRNQWRFREGRLDGIPLGSRAGDRILDESLEANQSAVGKAIEGNPWTLHERVARDSSSRSIVRARARRPEAPAPGPTPPRRVEVRPRDASANGGIDHG